MYPEEPITKMLIGGVICACGLLITIGSYSAASASPAGGRYVIAWGAIVFGGGMFLLNLARLSNRRGGIPLDERQEEHRVRRQKVVVYTLFFSICAIFVAMLIAPGLQRVWQERQEHLTEEERPTAEAAIISQGVSPGFGTNIFISGERYKSETGLTLSQCAAGCREHGACSAYTYNARRKECLRFLSVTHALNVRGYFSDKVR